MKIKLFSPELPNFKLRDLAKIGLYEWEAMRLKRNRAKIRRGRNAMNGTVRFYVNSICVFALLMTFTVSYTLHRNDQPENKEFSYNHAPKPEKANQTDTTAARLPDDLHQIKERKKLIALVGYSPNSYFVYRGTPMGFEHDLLQLFAKELGVSLEIRMVHDHDKLIEKLRAGEGDIIADNLIVTKERDALVDFSYPVMTTRQVLVQRRLTKREYRASLIRSPLQLIHETVHVRKGTAFYERLQNISEEIGGEICIVEEPGDCGTEELIKRVSEGKIPMTVADEGTALLQKDNYPNLDIETALSFEQNVAWAVRNTSPLLLEELNRWLRKIKKEKTFNRVYRKYFQERKGAKELANCTKFSFCGRRISAYDELIKYYARQIGWDWRLLASLIYQESQFKPAARSWAGASGLMQLMPGTAEAFGAVDTEDPNESLKAGTKYLKWLEKYWEKKVPDKQERLKFILASYNVGQEHVADAQRLAEKYSKNPLIWDDNVAFYLLMKSDEKYCRDPVVKYGYCRGKEPFEYVKNILIRYEHYKKLIHEEIHAQGMDTKVDGKS